MGSQSSRLLPGGALWAKVEDFTERFDPVQIRYAGNLFTRLIDMVAKAARTALKVGFIPPSPLLNRNFLPVYVAALGRTSG